MPTQPTHRVTLSLLMAVIGSFLAGGCILGIIHAGNDPYSRGGLWWLATILYPGLIALAKLATWSRHSHLLAVGHGMIPRWSSTWITWCWLVPIANLFAPFSSLRERWRHYRCAGGRIILITQALVWASLALFATRNVSCGIAACFAAGLGLQSLRRVVQTLIAAQQVAEQQSDAERVFG